MRTMRSLILSLAVLTVLPGAAFGGDEQELAKKYFLEGKQAYLEGRYHAAVASFRAAAALRPSPILDFNIGRCFEKLGNHDQAIAAYEKYLASAKEAENREDVKARIARLKEERRKLRNRDPYEEIERGGAAPSPRTGASPPPPAVAAQPPPASRAATPPPAARAEAEPAHEATMPRSWGGPAADRPRTAAPPPRSPYPPRGPAAPAPRRDQGPVYKQWWFWVACAAGATVAALFIATAVYAGGGSSTDSQQRGLEVRV